MEINIWNTIQINIQNTISKLTFPGHVVGTCRCLTVFSQLDHLLACALTAVIILILSFCKTLDPSKYIGSKDDYRIQVWGWGKRRKRKNSHLTLSVGCVCVCVCVWASASEWVFLCQNQGFLFIVSKSSFHTGLHSQVYSLLLLQIRLISDEDTKAGPDIPYICKIRLERFAEVRVIWQLNIPLRTNFGLCDYHQMVTNQARAFIPTPKD